jgi:O-antigen/teichoic acid export membrane protein
MVVPGGTGDLPTTDDGAPGGGSSSVASTVLTFGTNLAVAVLSLANVLVVSRALGPDGRGDVAFLTTVSFLTSNLAMLGVQEANANFAARHAERRRALASNSVVLAVLFGGAAALVLALVFHYFPRVGPEETHRAVALALAALPMLVLHDYLEYLARAEYGYWIANVAWLCAPITNVVVNGALAVAGVLTVPRAFGTWVAGWTLSTALLAWWLGTRSSGFGRPDPALAREATGFGLKTHGGRVMTLGNYRLDQWLLGAIAGDRQLGLYSVAVAWSEVLFFLPTALALAQRPDIVRSSPREAGRKAAIAFRLGFVATAAMGAAMIGLAPFLCVTIFGSGFAPSVEMLRILVPGALGMVALKVFQNALNAQGMPLRAAVGIAAAFAGTIALDVALIPDHGGVGASLASTIAYLAGGVVISAIFVRSLGARPVELVPHGSDVPWTVRKLRAAFSR